MKKRYAPVIVVLAVLAFVAASLAAGPPAPRYLEATAYGGEVSRDETVAFAQACFWRGEVALGRIPGVITTEAGWMEGREVTLVHYRPDLVELDDLIDRAIAAGVSDKVYLPTREERKRLGRERRVAVGALDDSYRRAEESDQKRQIRGSAFAELALSEMQRTKINAFATVDMREALAWLTPSQLEAFEP